MFVTEVPYPTDEERLRTSIRTELRAQRAMADLALDDTALDQLADAIAYNTEEAFAVRWAPRWVKDGAPHRWTEPVGGEPTEHFVDCIRCRRMTVHKSAAEADAWYERHGREEHTKLPAGD